VTATEAASPDPVVLAQDAAETALPFADHLAKRCALIAEALRQGQDDDALHDLGITTSDLQDFLTFLTLMIEIAGDLGQHTASGLIEGYRDRLVKVLETISPALEEVDLVEVADAIDDDLVPSLEEYRDVDDTIQDALQQAA
jgi:hypothetical protein